MIERMTLQGCSFRPPSEQSQTRKNAGKVLARREWHQGYVRVRKHRRSNPHVDANTGVETAHLDYPEQEKKRKYIAFAHGLTEATEGGQRSGNTDFFERFVRSERVRSLAGTNGRERVIEEKKKTRQGKRSRKGMIVAAV